MMQNETISQILIEPWNEKLAIFSLSAKQLCYYTFVFKGDALMINCERVNVGTVVTFCRELNFF